MPTELAVDSFVSFDMATLTEALAYLKSIFFQVTVVGVVIFVVLIGIPIAISIIKDFTGT